MRRILITPDIEKHAKLYAEDLKAGKNLSKKPKDRLQTLKNDLASKRSHFKFSKRISNPKTGRKKCHFDGYELPLYSKYVEKIISQYDDLNNLHPRSFDTLINDMETTYADVDLSVPIRIGNKGAYMSFANHIVKAMDYDGARNNVIRHYLSQTPINIKTCVYCNGQYALTTVVEPAVTAESISKRKGRGRRPKPRPAKLGATYELDHNLLKDKYPYLCTNFYNLQPSCSSCNRNKKDSLVRFSVYYWDAENPDPLHFELDNKDIIEFQLRNKCDGIKPILTSSSTDTSLVEAFNKNFSIDAIYSQHSDEVQELLWRHKIYSSSGMDAIRSSYAKLFADGFDAERFVYGTYLLEKDVHRRPLTIMKQDIIRQIKEEESKGGTIPL